MITLMPGICFASKADKEVLNRIWDYRRNFSVPVNGVEQNVYLRYSFSIVRRNPTLFLVPTMYVVAKGDRDYVGESYCRLNFRSVGDYELKRQVVCGTIPRQRIAMPTMFEFLTPNLYDVTLYPDHLLSPFHRSNRWFYRYTLHNTVGDTALLDFRPKTKNTQLVSGQAIVNTVTGRLMSVHLEGFFDQINFHVTVKMASKDTQTPLPELCTTETSFKFLGNNIESSCTAVFNCPTTLPDSLNRHVDRAMMASLRPIPLTSAYQHVYDQYDERERQEQMEEARDTTATNARHHTLDVMKDFAWNVIGDNLINGNSASSGRVTMKFSPLFNPLYLGYSRSQGISYRLDLGFRYNWNAHRYLTFNPRLGYNFKLKQFFYTTPIRMTYNPKRNGYAEIRFANGNRISNDALAQDFHKIMGDTVSMPEFNDQNLHIVNNVEAFDWLEVMAGVVYHRRTSRNRSIMEEAGLPTEFHSFAPLLTLRFTPWYKGPTLTVNYERSINNLFSSNLEYERWELDAAFIHRMKSLQIFNIRAGAGFYTQRNSNYFVDYTNFRAENLPSGWEDDWSGQFQLLSSLWYNSSDYYLRGHVSYDAPMLLLSNIPLIGKGIEKERIYVSALSIQHTRPYFELGYGFSNRFYSTAVFCNLLGGKVQEFGFKFTVELFRRW